MKEILVGFVESRVSRRGRSSGKACACMSQNSSSTSAACHRKKNL